MLTGIIWGRKKKTILFFKKKYYEMKYERKKEVFRERVRGVIKTIKSSK